MRPPPFPIQTCPHRGTGRAFPMFPAGTSRVTSTLTLEHITFASHGDPQSQDQGPCGIDTNNACGMDNDSFHIDKRRSLMALESGSFPLLGLFWVTASTATSDNVFLPPTHPSPLLPPPPVGWVGAAPWHEVSTLLPSPWRPTVRAKRPRAQRTCSLPKETPNATRKFSGSAQPSPAQLASPLCRRRTAETQPWTPGSSSSRYLDLFPRLLSLSLSPLLWTIRHSQNPNAHHCCAIRPSPAWHHPVLLAISESSSVSRSSKGPWGKVEGRPACLVVWYCDSRLLQV